MYAHYLITLAIYVTGLGAYWYVSRPIGLDDAVSEGIGVLEDVGASGWIFFTIFWILSIIYFWNSFTNSMKSLFSGIMFVLGGMKVDPDWETVYNTPQWEDDAVHLQMESSDADGTQSPKTENAVLVPTKR